MPLRVMEVLMSMTAGWPFYGGWAARTRRGQTRVESIAALGVLIVAGVGAWLLYKDSIIETTRAMISFFGPSERP